MSIDLSKYIDVAERIRIFRDRYPEGSLQPVDPAKPYWIETIGEKTFVVYATAAYRTPDDPRPGIGLAWEPFPGRTNYTRDSELMNCETSSWGRAIIATLAADTQKIASREEVANRLDEEPKKKREKPIFETEPVPNGTRPSKAQVTYIEKQATALASSLGITATQLMIGLCGVEPKDLSEEAARGIIQELTRGRTNIELVVIDEETGKVTING